VLDFFSTTSLRNNSCSDKQLTSYTLPVWQRVSTLRCGAQIPDVMSVGRLKFRRAAPHICGSSEATYTQKTLLAPRALRSQTIKKSGHALARSPPGTEPTTATGYKTGCIPQVVQTCWTRPTLCPDGHMNQIPRSSSPQSTGNSGYLFISTDTLRHDLTI